MPGIVRQGDPNVCGGVVQGGVGSVRVNGIPVAVPGLAVSPHDNYRGPHVGAVTRGGSGSVRAQGQPIITTADNDSCGHNRGIGSGDVRIG